jgi:hypothetical protein
MQCVMTQSTNQNVSAPLGKKMLNLSVIEVSSILSPLLKQSKFRHSQKGKALLKQKMFDQRSQ